MAKRVNKRFLVILTTVVLVGSVAGMGAMFVLQKVNKKDPQQLVAESDRQLEAGNLDGAIIQMQGAVGSRQQDPELRVKLGDLYNRAVTADRQNFIKARQAWESALGVDPSYKPALERLLEQNWAIMLAAPQQPETFRKVREIATKLLAADPLNAVAQARMQISTIRQAESKVPTRADEVEKAVKSLWELAAKEPADAELPYWAIRGEIYLAGETAKQLTDVPQAREAIAKLVPAIERMLKGQETNPTMQLRAAQLLSVIPTVEKMVDAGGNPTTAPTSRPKGRPAGQYTDRVSASLKAAREHVKQGDKNYVEIQLANVEWMKLLEQPEEASKLLEKLVEERGEDPVVRLAYSRTLRHDPAQREKIIELLSKPVSMEGVSGVDALNRVEMKSAMTMEALTLRLTAIEGERDAAKRKAVIDDVTAEVKRAEATGAGQSVPMLELKGRLAFIQGKLAEAVRLLQQAVDQRGPDSPNFETIMLLANAYYATSQTGQSEKLLQQVVARAPDHVPARVMWINVLMNDGQVAEARTQLAAFKKRSPDAKELPGLEALVEGGKVRDQFVDKLPENTPAERLRKAMILRNEGKVDEAIVLADAAFKEDPKYLPAVEQLIEMYVAADRRDEALAVTQAAIAANPDNAQLKSLPDKLVKRTPEELDKWRLEQIASESDPVMREVRSYEFYAQKSVAAAQKQDEEERKKNAALAEQHLAAAEKLKPGDVRVDSRRFEDLLRQRRFDDAGPVLQKLAAANSDEVNGQLLRFRLAMAKNDLGAAEAAARDITRQRAPFALGWQLLGAVMQAQGRNPEAIEAYTAALERQGKNYEAMRGLIDIYYKVDDIPQAKSTLERARQAFPNDVTLREIHLNHELAYGDPAKAIAEREKLLKDNPENSANSLALADTYLRSTSLETDEKKNQATINKARAVLEAGIKKWPNDRRFQLPLAQVRLEEDDFLGGETILKEYAAAPDVDKVQADSMLADYYLRAAKPNMAEELLRDAVQRSNGAPVLKSKLASLLAQTGRVDDALKELENVPGDVAARQRVQLLVATGKPDEALKAVDQALAANPASLDLSNQKLDLLIGANRLPDAEKLIQQRLARNDRDEAARYTSALIKLRKQPADVAGAATELNRLAERNPRNAQIRSLLADAHIAAGDPSSAIDDLARAVELAPQDRELRLKLVTTCASQGNWESVRKFATEATSNPRMANDTAWPRALASAAAGMRQYAEAEKQITRAISLASPEQTVEIQRDHHAILIQAKSYPKALKITDDWLAKGLKEWWVYQLRGVTKSGMKDKTAVKDFDTALSMIKPEEQVGVADAVIRSISTSLGIDEALKRLQPWEAVHPRWRVLAAELCLEKPDPAAALAHLEPVEKEADKLPPDVGARYYRLVGQSHHMTKPTPDLTKTITAYEKYLALAPNDVLALNNIAYLLSEGITPPRPQDAKIYSKKAYDIAKTWRGGDPKSRILDTHGWVLILSQGSGIDDGIRILQEAIDEYPIVEARYHIGEAQLLKKRGAEAEEQLTAALAMIDKAKKDKTPYDESLEPKIQSALERAKAINASAGAR